MTQKYEERIAPWHFRWSHCGELQSNLFRKWLWAEYYFLVFTLICLLFNELPCISCISPLLFHSCFSEPIFLSPCSSALMLLTFIFPSAPLFRPPSSWTLLSPLVPVVQSPTNGAHYCCAKYSPAAKSGFFSCFPSFSHQNFPPSPPQLPQEGNE